MTTSEQVRRRLLEALRLDLVGPSPSDPAHAHLAEETLPTAPSTWYLTGFLVPYEAPPAQRSDADGQDELEELSARKAYDDDAEPERASARKAFFPSSMGLSTLVGPSTERLEVEVAWGDYLPLDVAPEEEEADGSTARAARNWRRRPGAARVGLGLGAGTSPVEVEVPGSEGLKLVSSVREVGDVGHLPRGTRSVSVFLVNHRDPAPDETADAACAFQPELIVRCAGGFVPRPDVSTHGRDERDEQVADLQYRDCVEHAVGHAVSVEAVRDERGDCHEVRTTWMPRADVEKVIAADIEGATFDMEALARAGSADEMRALMAPMAEAYGAWIGGQAAVELPDAEHARVARELLERAERAKGRIQAGLAALDDPLVLEAFRFANSAIARAIRQRACHDRPDRRPEEIDPPQWRPFQLAFLLMNLVGVARPESDDRGVVDLLFFPTGGGKTEAYLGLAAFTMVLRRLREPTVQSAGVSVVMRYTLRLLTLDQLGRAATLVCALELERQQDVEKLGPWPFEIGLWVGQAATPNAMGEIGKDNEYSARRRTRAYQDNDKLKPSPIPLENCPWCGWTFDAQCFRLMPDANKPTDLRVTCRNRGCEFHGRRQAKGLPILSVDEPLYRRLPAFLIATVDKFASLPWVGDTAGLFGRVERHDAEGFHGPSRPNRGTPLERPLPPPDLIIQDELHLISGPLGTMMGLYETAIDALCAGAGAIACARPKIVASTATVRRAQRQIRGVFGRTAVDVFPPPGPDRRNSFFAKTVPPSEKAARSYVGIAAPGRNLKVVLLRTTLALVGAAQAAWKEAGGVNNPENPADPYMTLLGYFNSLRELGGSRRIIEDEVHAQATDRGDRRRRVGEATGLFANRPKMTEPRELTSRVSTSEVAETKRRLALSFAEKERVDIALATNMISVGLDITRLGLMVVLGQPKTASEYIQATSRVGRDEGRPGLVVTLLNVHRHRDRSHYERFVAWHESFYRAVEATSVTPFSPRAIDRGIAAVTVALARLGNSALTAPASAADVAEHRGELDFVCEAISRRAEAHDVDLSRQDQEDLRQAVRGRVADLLDTWVRLAQDKGQLQYGREVGTAPPLLFDPLDPELDKQPREARKFKANRSLRDVEPSVNLWLRTPDSIGSDLGSA